MERIVSHIRDFIDSSLSDSELGTRFGQGTLLVFIIVDDEERYIPIEKFFQIVKNRKITKEDFR